MSATTLPFAPLRRWLQNTTALVGAVPLVLMFVGTAQANPVGGTVAQGSATIGQSGNTTTITQTTNKAVINWQSFSIGSNELTQFLQPSSSSVTLNRVTGNQVSQILGKLKANGQIFLVNPNGIVFGNGAQIDVAALTATTHGITDQNFMAGNYRFDTPGKANAQIINQGTITATDGGLVALVAPSVRNSGLIQARLGKVALASGNGFTLDLYGDSLILFQASDKIASQVTDASGKPVSALVQNDGKVYADGGSVLMTANAAKGVVDQAVNMTGLVSARAVDQQGGEIVLKGEDSGIVQVSGVLDASGKQAGQKGGTINVLGDVVALQSTAKVDVSGDTGGGTALIGGDYLGGGSVRNADIAYMAKGAVIDASAITTGNGGKSILWANNTTRSYGAIYARGGRLSGNGGFVETSGKVYLAQEGSVDASAPKGQAGTWLMDPGTIYIQDGVTESSTQSNNCVDCYGSYLYRASTSDPAYVNTATINAALNAGNNVWIYTNDSSSDIHVEGNITFTKGQGATSDMNLWLLAGRDIYVTSGTIKQTGTATGLADRADLNVFLMADRSRVGTGSVYIGDVARATSTIDIGAGLTIEATNLVKIYGTADPLAYTIKANSNVNIGSNVTQGQEVNVDEIYLPDHGIFLQDNGHQGNVTLWTNTLTLPNQGNGISEIALSGSWWTTALNYADVEITHLPFRSSNNTVTSENSEQTSESANINSNNRERRSTNGLTDIAKNVDGSDLGQLAHNIVAGYLRSINFDTNSDDPDSLREQTKSFETIRSLVYDSLNKTPVEGKGYEDLFSLLMSGDIQPNMNNQLWRALMIGDQLSPAQQAALEMYNDISGNTDNSMGDRATLKFNAVPALQMAVLSTKIENNSTKVSPLINTSTSQNASSDTRKLFTALNEYRETTNKYNGDSDRSSINITTKRDLAELGANSGVGGINITLSALSNARISLGNDKNKIIKDMMSVRKLLNGKLSNTERATLNSELDSLKSAYSQITARVSSLAKIASTLNKFKPLVSKAQSGIKLLGTVGTALSVANAASTANDTIQAYQDGDNILTALQAVSLAGQLANLVDPLTKSPGGSLVITGIQYEVNEIAAKIDGYLDSVHWDDQFWQGRANILSAQNTPVTLPPASTSGAGSTR